MTKKQVVAKKTPKKSIKKRKATRVQDAAGGHDVKSRKKFDRGGRIEAYTFGEALGSKDWP